MSSVLIVNWDLNLTAENLDNEINDTSTPRSNGHPRAGDFDWGEIEVISEPIFGQNNNIDSSYNPKIAIENENIYVVWYDNTNYNGAGSDIDIFYRFFNGSNWSKIQVISEPVLGQNNNVGVSAYPDIAVENGKIYVFWHDKNNTNGAGSDWDIFYRCNLTGTNWEDIQVISEPVFGQDFNIGESQYPSTVVENGKIYVVWTDLNNTNNAGTDSDIFYRCNITGSKWENIQIISEPIPGYNNNIAESKFPEIAVDNSKIHIVWEDHNNTNNAGGDGDIFYRCNLSSSNWEPVQIISEPVQGKNFNVGNSEQPSIALENGKTYIVWQDEDNTNGAGSDWDIFYRCNLTGIHWETIQVISEFIIGSDNNTGESSLPAIMVKNNKIYVVWQDTNNTYNAGTDWDIFYRCNLTETNWEDILIISEPIMGYDINTGTSGSPDIAVNYGKSYIVWFDANNTNSAGTDGDIFYNYIFLPLILSHPSITPIAGNTSTYFDYRVKYIHLNDMTPTKIIVNISGKEYSMLEVDPYDTNYVDGKDYFFKINNLDIGINSYKLHTSDGKFTWSSKLVKKPIVYNTPPTIITDDKLTAIEDVYFEMNYEYEDIDVINIGQHIIWNFSTNADWLNFNSNTAMLNGTPSNDDVGEYWINISVDDTIDSDYTNFTLTVINVNDAPIIIMDNIRLTKEDELYEKNYKAIDIDTPQINLIWNMQTNASWLDFEHSTAKLSGIPENDDVGVYWVSISVSDTEYINYSNFTLQVINVNDPPRIITKDNKTAIEDEFYEMIYKAEDVDNTQFELFWNINTNAKWLNYDILTAIINGIPTNDDIGDYWVNISVSDNEFIDFTNFTLTVLNTNDPPMIITKDKTNATVGELYSINYEAVDIDPPPISLTWSINTNASDWLTIDIYNGWLNGIPSVSDIGTYWVNVTVTDGESGWDFHNFTLKVLKKPVQLNYAPQLFNISMTPSEGDIETVFTFSVHYFDEDGNNPEFIQLVIDDFAYNMKLKLGENPSNGTYEHNVTLSEGVHLYFFIAFDGFETVRTNYFTTPYIKDIDKISTEEISWYWLFLIVIVIIIIIVLISMLVLKKRKAMKLPTVQAEMLRATPEPIALPSAIPSADIATPLAAQPMVSEQLPSPKVQVQPSEAIPSETISTPSLAPTTIETQFQLPKATLSKAQRLDLLQERFLKGEVTEETYKELRAEIEAYTGEDITRDEAEDQINITEQQPLEASEQPILEEAISTSTPGIVGKPPQQIPIEPKITQPQTVTQIQPQKELSTEKENDEENIDQKNN